MTSSLKLTSSDRALILGRLFAHRFDKQKQAIKAAEQKLAKRIYDDRFSAADRRRMSDLPDGWLPEIMYVHAKISGSHQRLDLGDGKYRVPHKHYNGVLKVYEGRDAIAETFRQLEGLRSAYESERQVARAEAVAVLGSVTTLAKLLSVWPEIKPFTVGVAAAPPANQIAVNVVTLNQSFGLPVKVSKAKVAAAA